VVPVPDPLLLRKPGSAGNRTRDLWICNQKLRRLDHRGGLLRRNKPQFYVMTSVCQNSPLKNKAIFLIKFSAGPDETEDTFHARFEVPAVLNTEISVFWNVRPCSLVDS
jgi:hypothetical protein